MDKEREKASQNLLAALQCCSVLCSASTVYCALLFLFLLILGILFIFEFSNLVAALAAGRRLRG